MITITIATIVLALALVSLSSVGQGLQVGRHRQRLEQVRN